MSDGQAAWRMRSMQGESPVKAIVARNSRRWLAGAVIVVGVVAAVFVTRPARGGSAPAVHLWDTVTPLHGSGDVRMSQQWRSIDAAAPGKLRGDLVVQTDAVAAAFASRLGQVLLNGVAIRPVALAGKQAQLTATASERNGAVTVRADFRAPGAKSLPISFSFMDGRILAITPEGNTRGVSVAAPIELAIVPSFVGDDLIYDARNYPSAETLSLPSEHFLLGLVKGEASMLVLTWQEAMPSVRLALTGSAGKQSIGAVNFTGGGLSLALLEAPGIWHREPLTPSMLERDVAISWKPPFPATWLTQLYEDDVRTTFEFRRGRHDTWRGGVGSYIYPTWFSQGKTMLSLGKKIPPEGEAIIYFLERAEGTPPQVVSPIEVAQRTLHGDVLTSLLDVDGREAWFPERPDHVIGAATCATTDAFMRIFNAGEEVQKLDLVKGGVKDMYYYLEQMQRMDARFPSFAKKMSAYLDAQQQANPRLAPYFRELRATAAEIVTTYDESRDTIRDMAYAHELGDKTIALASQMRPDNVQRMADLKQDWTGMGGALEHLAAREHTLTRRLYQQAGYLAATRPEAIPIAQEVRTRTRHCLERPESYEMWANY
jgi:hypothetical protein